MEEPDPDLGHRRLGGRIEHILRQAEEQAGRLRVEAEQSAARMRKQAELHLQQASSEAEEIRARAEADGARLRAGACPECLRRERGPLSWWRRLR